MQDHVLFECPDHADPFDCPDTLVCYSEVFDEYGLMVHDGGSSLILIAFCPWCGKKLPDSKRPLWFATLTALGYKDPWEEDIPEEYRSNRWYKDS